MGFRGHEGDITKEHEEMFGGDEYVHYLSWDVSQIYTCQNLQFFHFKYV